MQYVQTSGAYIQPQINASIATCPRLEYLSSHVACHTYNSHLAIGSRTGVTTTVLSGRRFASGHHIRRPLAPSPPNERSESRVPIDGSNFAHLDTNASRGHINANLNGRAPTFRIRYHDKVIPSDGYAHRQQLQPTMA